MLRRLLAQPHAAAALLQSACAAAGPSARPFSLVQLAALSASAAAASGKLLGAVVFERLPVVVPEDPEWEREYFEWQDGLAGKYRKELPREFTDLKDSEMKEDAGASYEPAPRVTAADHANDRRSLKRRLDQRLFMLVRQKGGWTLPQQENAEGETMRQTAERALADAVELEAVRPYFVGNAPAGHAPLGDAGTLFFHRCQLIQGVPALRGGSGYSEHVWVTKEELGEYLQQPDVLAVMQKML